MTISQQKPRISTAFATALSLATISSTAFADARGGTVDDIKITASGTLKVDGNWAEVPGNDLYYAVCDLDATWNSITPQTCAAWLTLLTAAQLSGKEVLIEWGANVTPVVDGQPGTVPAPQHVKLR